MQKKAVLQVIWPVEVCSSIGASGGGGAGALTNGGTSTGALGGGT